MGISDRLLGKKNVNGKPHIQAVQPAAALAGGEVRITGSDLSPHDLRRPRVRFGEVEGAVVISSDDFVVAKVPQGASSGPIVVSTNGHSSNAHQIKVAVTIAEDLHPVTNPALDAEGNIYVSFSGSRGQKVKVAVFKIDTNYNVKPFVGGLDECDFDCLRQGRADVRFVALRRDGVSSRAERDDVFLRGRHGSGNRALLLIACGNLYVGDRSGTIFKIAPDRQIFVFATLEPSVSAYHLAFGPRGDLFVTGPDDFEFRLCVPDRRARQRHEFLSGAGTAAGSGF